MGSTATTVANAAGAAITRTLLGILLGITVGVAVFFVEKSAGWLDATGWTRAAIWALLPAYVAAGGAVLGYGGFWSGIRRAVRIAFIDNGALGRMVDRMLARARKTAGATDTAAAAAEEEPAPKGWGATRLAAIGQSLARTIVARLGSAGNPDAETGAQVTRIADELVDDIGLVPSIIGLVLLAATFAVAPLLLA